MGILSLYLKITRSKKCMPWLKQWLETVPVPVSQYLQRSFGFGLWKMQIKRSDRKVKFSVRIYITISIIKNRVFFQFIQRREEKSRDSGMLFLPDRRFKGVNVKSRMLDISSHLHPPCQMKMEKQYSLSNCNEWIWMCLLCIMLEEGLGLLLSFHLLGDAMRTCMLLRSYEIREDRE
jgi:hypothetical protein